ncbi:hypothetical protein [Rhodopseudomonas palustris]|uniref:hypothetical protein n=1 Tax=Rhodopseudomonas palustris TaxID=1076 RepID=UPI0021F281AA|nr:hypothetical protein [Rhodopseudomonas palustris]UYO54612.1 hypothetical protein KQX61_04090 [Rhodopseudomonas palustris]
MEINVKRLRSDVNRLKRERRASPIGKAKTGATEIIRKHFVELERLHYQDGASWTEIAAALAEQGVTQGDGKPITSRRLTALMNNIRVQAKRNDQQKSSVASGQRSVRPSGARASKNRVSVSLAPELLRSPHGKSPELTLSEEEIRRAELARHAHLLPKR